MEDLLVSVADKVSKGRRVVDLEQLAADADRRLAFQASPPV
ncbi:hypothetical protein [Micromonospora sp. DT47]